MGFNPLKPQLGGCINYMKALAFTSIACSIGALASLIFVVVADRDSLNQFLSFDFPLTGLGEGIIVMIVPLFLSLASIPLGIWPVIRNSQVAIVSIVIGWVSFILCLVFLGDEGLSYLF
jgi:hypothetical protein